VRRLPAAAALASIWLWPGPRLLPEEGPPHARYTFGTLGGKRQLAQDSSRLYGLSTQGELLVFEKPEVLGPPAARTPAPVGKLKLEGVPEALEWVDGHTLCVGTGNHLAFVDVSAPSRPALLRDLPLAEREIYGVSEIRRKGQALYVAARKQGLLRVDISDPLEPRKSGSLPVRGFATGIDVEGDLAAVAAGAGLALVRIGGGELKLESEIDTFRNAEVVRLWGKRLVFCSKEYLVVYDLSDPAHPVELGEVSNRDPFFHSHNVGLEIAGGFAYLAATEGGLYVYDLSEPREPRLTVQYSFWGNEHRVTLEGKLKYLEELGLAGSLEERERSMPRVENIHIPAVGMAVEGSRVYLADTQGRLWALEVSLGESPSARCVMSPQ
jgi:hypothetical protein